METNELDHFVFISQGQTPAGYARSLNILEILLKYKQSHPSSASSRFSLRATIGARVGTLIFLSFISIYTHFYTHYYDRCGR
jgi:hypothetical protein